MASSRRPRPALPEPAKQLITLVTGFDSRSQYFESCSHYVSTQLYDVTGIGGVRNKAVDHQLMDQRINGLAEKFSMKGQEQKAKALASYLIRLRDLARSMGKGDQGERTINSGGSNVNGVGGHGGHGGTFGSGAGAGGVSSMEQDEAAQNVVSSVLLMMLELSEAPTLPQKDVFGYTVPEGLRDDSQGVKTLEQQNKELLQAILMEDPFVGEHWESQKQEPEAQDSDDSDFEDMDVHPRIVPNADQERGQEDHEEDRAKCFATTLSTRYSEHTTAIAGLGFDFHLPATLNAAIRNGKVDVVDYKEVLVMKEIDVIHEVFFVLLGLPSIIFSRMEEGHVKITTPVTVSHLSTGALESLLQPFLEGAGVIYELQDKVDSLCSASSRTIGKVVQAFSLAVKAELVKLRSSVAATQEQYRIYQKGTAHRATSLIELQTLLSENLQIATTLLEFLQQASLCDITNMARDQSCTRSTNLLSHLYEHVCSYELCGDSRKAGLFYRLLQKSMHPFLVNVESWLAGRPLDSESEFMIDSASSVGLLSNAFWNEGFYFKTEGAGQSQSRKGKKAIVEGIRPSFLSQASLDRIMYAGKATRVIDALKPSENTLRKIATFSNVVMDRIFGTNTRQDCVIPDEATPSLLDARLATFTSIPSILEHLSRKSTAFLPSFPLDPLMNLECNYTQGGGGDGNRINDGAALVIGADFSWRMEAVLEEVIEEEYKATSTVLKSMLLTQSRLLWHLKGMADFYFMMDGEIMHAFSGSIFHKMRKGQPWCEPYVLGSTFNDLATEYAWKHAEFTNIRVSGPADEKKRKGTLSAEELEKIRFEYLLPWPLTGILHSTENSKRMYGRITNLLLQVKVAKHALERPLFLKTRHDRRSRPEFGMCWKLRLRFLSMMNDLWSYFMMSVLNTQIQRFHAEIEGQCDLDGLIQLSRRFIHICYERCFLEERTLPLHRSLITILQLALKFSTLFATFLREQDPREMKGGRDVSSGSSESESEVEELGGQAQGGRSRDKRKVESLRRRIRDFDGGNSEAEDDAEVVEDDDMEVDVSEWAGRTKKAKMDVDISLSSGLSSSMPLPSGTSTTRETSRETHDLPPAHRRGTPGRPASASGTVFVSGSDSSLVAIAGVNAAAGVPTKPLLEQLLALETEFDRCREFSAKGLRIVVDWNAARSRARSVATGYGRHGGGRFGQQQDEIEGADYLDGLILAFSG